MMFDHIIGNQNAKDYLAHTAHRQMVGNSLLFAGPDGVGKSLFADAFAKLLLCQDDPKGRNKHKIEAGNHPDIRIYRPEGKIAMHTIASMRQFNEEVYLAPFEGKWKVFIIHEADRMLSYSANALLKTFEEPAPDTVIILLSSAPSTLLSTVLSRCRTIYFHPISEQEIVSFVSQRFDKTNEETELIAHLAQGSIGQALRLANEGTNPLRGLILNLLSKGGVNHYKELVEIATQIAEGVDVGKKVVETEIRKGLLRGMGNDHSASQKQSLEKEVEGAIAMHTRQEAYGLFEMILSWYRDLHLMSLNGNPAYLMHRDFLKVYQSAVSKERLMPIEKVQKAVAETRLAIERSTSLQICLENLFLKLNLL